MFCESPPRARKLARRVSVHSRRSTLASLCKTRHTCNAAPVAGLHTHLRCMYWAWGPGVSCMPDTFAAILVTANPRYTSEPNSFVPSLLQCSVKTPIMLSTMQPENVIAAYIVSGCYPSWRMSNLSPNLWTASHACKLYCWF